MKKNGFIVLSVLFVVFFAMSVSCHSIYASANDEKESHAAEEKNVLETYDTGIIDEEDEDLFADFDKIIEEDLDELFDEISTTEDVEEFEVTPELFDDEIVDDTIIEESILNQEDEMSLIKD